MNAQARKLWLGFTVLSVLAAILLAVAGSQPVLLWLIVAYIVSSAFTWCGEHARITFLSVVMEMFLWVRYVFGTVTTGFGLDFVVAGPGSDHLDLGLTVAWLIGDLLVLRSGFAFGRSITHNRAVAMAPRRLGGRGVALLVLMGVVLAFGHWPFSVLSSPGEVKSLIVV